MEQGMTIALIFIGVCIAAMIVFAKVSGVYLRKFGHSLTLGAVMLTVTHTIYFALEIFGSKGAEPHDVLYFLPLICVWAGAALIDILQFKAMGILAFVLQLIVSVASIIAIVFVIAVMAALGGGGRTKETVYYSDGTYDEFYY